MAAQRKNILQDETARKDFIAGVLALKREKAAGDELSTYDRYVLWHYRAMMTLTPPDPRRNPDSRNAAHIGPVFPPWHRMFLSRLEGEIQRVLGKAEFRLPYWSWAADAKLADPTTSALWAADCLGPAGGPVASGPFRYDAANPTDPANWHVRLSDDIFEAGPVFQLVDRGLYRDLGGDGSLPQSSRVRATLQDGVYDIAPWGRYATGSFRCDLEVPLHNTVHRWVGGDMVLACSPNDPVFFLHHCNVDRIWASWQKARPELPYLPDQQEGEDLLWHRIEDPMFPMGDAPAARVRDVLGADPGLYDVLEELQ